MSDNLRRITCGSSAQTIDHPKLSDASALGERAGNRPRDTTASKLGPKLAVTAEAESFELEVRA